MSKPDKTHFDPPWKTITGKHFEKFMAFFFPDAHQDIDWSKGFESKDGELQKILPEQDMEKRIVDKLIRVTLNDGSHNWVYIHVEFQNQHDPGFAKRVYMSHYRISDYFKEQVVSLAILGDDSASWKPDTYQEMKWKMNLCFQFPIVKLLSYNDKWDWLETHDNPFAIVTMAHLKTREFRKDPNELLRWKIHLVKSLFARDWDRKTIIDLLRFIEWLYTLPKQLELQYRQTIASQGGQNMEYLATFEREAMDKGKREGKREGKLGMVAKLLKLKFGELPEWVEAKLKNAKEEHSEIWGERILTAQSFEEVFAED